jgi:hypothetical protein
MEKVVPIQTYRESLKDQLTSLKVERELLYDALDEALQLISELLPHSAPTQKFNQSIQNLEAFRENFVLRQHQDFHL